MLRRYSLCAVCFFVVLCCGVGADEPITRSPIFTDVTQSAGLDFEHTDGKSGLRLFNEFLGSGGGFFDYDNDGDLDIYLVNGAVQTSPSPDLAPTNVLFRNDGDGTFTNVTRAAGVGDTGYGTGCTIGDYDNDGYLDLYVTNFGPDVLYQNNGNMTFTDVTDRANIENLRWATSCAFADVDNDGFLDLYVANYADYDRKQEVRCEQRGVHIYCGPHAYLAIGDTLFHNKGDGTFTNNSVSAFSPGLRPFHGLGVTFGDYDNDGDLDLYVANDQDPNFLFENQGDGTFLEVGLLAGVRYNDVGKEEAGMGTDFGDYDRDGWLDLTVSNFQTETNTIYHNRRASFFSDNTITSGVAEVTHGFLGWSIKFFDYDNDGDQDIFVANGHVMDNVNDLEKSVTYPQKNLLFQNIGEGVFRHIALSGGGLGLEKVSRGAAIGDYDNDGDLDILVTNWNQTADLLQNQIGNRNNWVQIQVVGRTSNRSGIGARIRIIVDGQAQYQEVHAGGGYLSFSDLRVHFGVGQAQQIEQLEIRWPSGQVDEASDLSVNQRLVAIEGLEIKPLDD